MWIVSVTVDADKSDVGDVTATWNAGQPDEFTYSQRAKIASAADADRLVAAAKKALAARATVSANSVNVQRVVEAAFARAEVMSSGDN